MAKNCKINAKTLKKIIEETLRHKNKPSVSDIVEIIRPFYAWNKEELVERELKNKARYIMSTFKDDRKVRTYFLDNNGVYINVEKSTDLADMDKVNRQLSKKYNGISGALAKVQNRITSVIEKYGLRKTKMG
jgi:hypothetical protein